MYCIVLYCITSKRTYKANISTTYTNKVRDKEERLYRSDMYCIVLYCIVKTIPVWYVLYCIVLYCKDYTGLIFTNLVEIRLPKKFSVSISILISSQALSIFFWKFQIWPPVHSDVFSGMDGLFQIRCRWYFIYRHIS